MTRRIVIIQGHPDPDRKRFGYRLAEAYVQAAQVAGHELRQLTLAEIEFPLLRSRQDYETGEPPETIRHCQEAVAWADHLVIFYPLWLGAMPALLKAFLEQLLRPGFAYRNGDSGRMQKLLTGKSARIVITMGMPAFFYRWYFGAHGLKNLQRNILGFCGVTPVRTTLIGMIEGPAARRAAWLRRMAALGRDGR